MGYDLLNKIIYYGGFVYGITRSKSDLKKFKNLNNCKIFCGDVRNNKIIKKVFKQSMKDKKTIHGLVNNAGQRQRKNLIIFHKKI